MVFAPALGRISKIELEPGKLAKGGEPPFAVISDEDVLVDVNLKETQHTHVTTGKLVQVEIDAYPDVV